MILFIHVKTVSYYIHKYIYKHTYLYTHTHIKTHTYALVYIQRERRIEKMVLKDTQFSKASFTN